MKNDSENTMPEMNDVHVQPAMSGENSVQQMMPGENSVQPVVPGENSVQQMMPGENSVQQMMPGEDGIQPEGSGKKGKKKKIKYHVKKLTREERIASISFVTPSVVGVMIFFIIPFFVVIYYANIDNLISKNFVGMQNFQNVLNNGAFKLAAKNTATFSLLSVPLAVILSMLMALLLEKNIPMKSMFRTFFLSPLMVPVASVVLIWQVLFDHHGVVNDAIMLFGGNPVDWFKSDYGQVVVVILFLWKNLGYNMILFMAALGSIPTDVLEVAKLDGAGIFKQFFYIKLRYISPTIFFVGIMSLINSFKVFREVYLLAGDYPVDSLYMLQHFMNNTFRSLDYQKLSAAAIIMSGVMVIVIGALFIFENKIGKDVEG